MQQRWTSSPSPAPALQARKPTFYTAFVPCKACFIHLSSVRGAQHTPESHSGRDGEPSLAFAVAAEMAVPLFTQPSASKEELQNACSFIQSECSFNRRPYNLFSVVCGGLRPLFSGSPVEAEILASISSLLSPPSKDGSWYRRPSARYVPSAQEALFTCGGLDSLVASLGYPSALNKPAIARYQQLLHKSRCDLIPSAGALLWQSGCNLAISLVLLSWV